MPRKETVKPSKSEAKPASDKPASDENETSDQDRYLKKMQDFGERSTHIAAAFYERQSGEPEFKISDPELIGKAFMDMTTKMMANPQKVFESQANLWTNYAKLWETSAKRLAGEETEPVIQPQSDDRRFKDAEWTDDVLLDTLKQSYLLSSQWMQSLSGDTEGLDDKTRGKVDFYTRQFVNALSPSNVAMINPKVRKATLESNGENLIKGFDNLLRDLEKGKGDLKITMTDETAFTPGENIATTKGKVVFQSDMMQLLQYEPSTDKVAKTPLLIIPPWINKYYILDLQPKNSLIKWAVDQGHTVFVISWVNPNKSHSHKKFDHYMLEGPLAALGAIKQATGEEEVNVIGYCIGGTLLACTLAYMAAKGDKRIKSATFLTTMVDFEEAGELSVFIDEEQLGNLEKHLDEVGYLDGAHMSQVFNMMRDNDLIWSFVINNYLMGREPMAFDLLYWNADNTCMPAMMHSQYLRSMYLENRLVTPGSMVLDDVPIDLTSIKTPIYMLSCRDDHIAPWTSTYRGTDHYAGPIRFVLSASGHIAGVVNPPAANKYNYWTNEELQPDADKWFEGAQSHEGSWWVDWDQWVDSFKGGKVDKRVPGDGELTAIEDAPGSYVMVRSGT